MKILRKVRQAHKLHQKELASLVGVSPTMVSLIEHGKYNPRPDVLIKFARILEADAAELMTEDDDLI